MLCFCGFSEDDIADFKETHLPENGSMVEIMEQNVQFSHALGKGSNPKRWIGVIKNEERFDVKVILSTVKGQLFHNDCNRE